jgi:hypothetical protein
MWWAVLLVGLFLIGGGLGWAYIPEHRHPFPHFAQSTGRFNGIVVAGIGLVLCVISLLISPLWVLLTYVGVIGGAAFIRFRRHANDLQTFLRETKVTPVRLAVREPFAKRPWRPRWSPVRWPCVVFGHDWHQVSYTTRPTLEAFKQDYDLLETSTGCQRCGHVGSVRDTLQRR